MGEYFYTPLLILHVIVCFVLVVIVLLQRGKGADLGAAFGGGASQTVFGARGAESFLGKLTQIAALVFMFTSISLAYLTSERFRGSHIEKSLVKKEQTAAAGAQKTEKKAAKKEKTTKKKTKSKAKKSKSPDTQQKKRAKTK